MKRLPVPCLLLALSFSSWGLVAASDGGAAMGTPAPVVVGLDIPPTDEGLPGAGPLRRADWFLKMWHDRRQAFAGTAAQDRGSVVFLGDSITQGWGRRLAGAFPGLHVSNRGLSGDTTRGVLIRLADDVIALQPQAVVLLIGTNDLEENASPEVIAANVKLILAALRTHRANLPVYLCAVLPSAAAKKRPVEKIRQVNELYRGLAQESPQVRYLDTWTLFADPQGDAKPGEFPDLLHPNDAGYAKFAGFLRPILADPAKP